MKRHLLILNIVSILFLSRLSAQVSNTSNLDVRVQAQPELFPVICKYISGGNSFEKFPGQIYWQITNNSSETVDAIVIAEINEWAEPVITKVIIHPSEQKKIFQTPFGIKMLSKHTTVPATLALKIKVKEKVIYEETKNINVRSPEEMIWSINDQFDLSELIACWVTPNDDKVENVLSIAKEKIFGRELSGYQNPEIFTQVRAIFNAVRDIKVSYVSSVLSFGKIGFTQRIRIPRESIIQKSANCIDGAVLFASLFENIGLEPVIVLIPSHAFVGVRIKPNSREILFIETTLVGRSGFKSIMESLNSLSISTTFDAAVKEGNEKFNSALKKFPKELRIIDIKEARKKGIYPLW